MERASDLLGKVACLAEKAKRRNLERRAEELDKVVQERDTVRLTPWSSSVRGIPNEVARSAVFTVRREKERFFLTDAAIFLVGKSRITYTGPELRASDDELVWLQILAYAQEVPLGNWFEFSRYKLCKDVGWDTSKYYYKKVRECLLRLSSVVLAIEVDTKTEQWCTARMVEEVNADGNSFAARLHPNVQGWFEKSRYTRLVWDAYLDLSPTARRLCDYAMSHRRPYSLKLATVQGMLGSDIQASDDLRKQLRKSCRELLAVGIQGWIAADDLLHLERKK